MVRSQKKALRRFFRSATHATDSTWRGWKAKRAATRALRQMVPVVFFSRVNKSRVLAMWSRRFVKWWKIGSRPKSWQSRMWLREVNGCHELQ